MSWFTAERVSALFTAIGAAGLVAAAIGVFQARSQIRNARDQIENAKDQLAEASRTRVAQMGAEISRRWDEPEMLETRRLVQEAPDDPAGFCERFFALYDSTEKENVELAFKLLRQANYLEDLAILEEEGAIGVGFIKRSLGFIVVRRWQLWRNVADEFERRNRVDNFPHFRALARRLDGDPDLA